MTPTAADLARFFGNYAKQYHAGGFATPTRREIEDGDIGVDYHEGDSALAIAWKVLGRDSNRGDFTGGKFWMPHGASVATHFARHPLSPLPQLPYDFVMAYAEDFTLQAQLKKQGYNHYATRITPSSEIIRVLWRGEPKQYPAYDRISLCNMGDKPPMDDLLADIDGLTGYADDVPLYSDGSWSALTLRGFYPDDPTRNAKPSEQDRKWKQTHPEDLTLPCVWTKLAADCPNIVDWVTSVSWWGDLERVRLLRMSRGHLSRHTDILDKFGGTRDGQVVRFHLPLVTHADIKMKTWDLDGQSIETHLRQGVLYYLDTRLPHSVTNPTDVERIHLVVDVAASDEVRDRIEMSHMAS